MFCSSAPAGGVSSPVSAAKPHLADLRRRAQRELALELEIVGDLLGVFAQLVGDLDAERKLALELVARVDADRDLPRFAPAPQRVLVRRGARVLRGDRVRRGDQAVLDRRVHALDERQRHEARQIERVRRPGEREARLPHIQVELFPDALAHPVDRDLDHRLDVARKRAQELLLDGARLRPVLEAHETRVRIDQLVARLVDESDRPRLQLVDGEPGDRGGLLEPKLLCGKLGGRNFGGKTPGQGRQA